MEAGGYRAREWRRAGLPILRLGDRGLFGFGFGRVLGGGFGRLVFHVFVVGDAGRRIGINFAAHFVFIHYVFRNAVIPFVTVLGLQVRYLLGGVVIIERVFGIAGMGSLTVDAAFARDYPVVQACALTFLAAVLAVNLIVDIVCALLDPRRTH